jgi:serine protease AprX
VQVELEESSSMRPLSLLSWNDKKRTRLMVTGLLAAAAAVAGGTPPAAAATLPGAGCPCEQVIVESTSGNLAAADRAIQEPGGRVLDRLSYLNASVAEVPIGEVAWLRDQPGVAEVNPDGPVQLASTTYSPTTDPGSLYSIEQQLGVDQAWADGYTGAGIGVALIDTGVTPVEGLAGPGQVINGADISFGNTSSATRYLDANGHGTFMAGIIAGRDPGAVPGKYAGDSADFLGIAPDSHIVNVRVGSPSGAVDVSQILAAIDWVIQQHSTNSDNIRVLNLSLGTDSTQSYLLDPLAFAAEAAWHHGIVVVAAAGNQGWNAGQLADPADDPYVIAVGASEGSGATLSVAPFSSSGNTKRSPDVVAPGKSVVSLRVPGSVIDDRYGSTATVDGRFFLGSGTSESTAVVAGLAALLVQEHPNASPDQIKALLTGTAAPVPGAPVTLAGQGQVSAAAAVSAPLPTTVQTFPPSIGTASLDAARGSLRASDGLTVSDEHQIAAFAPQSLAEVEQTSWTGTSWAGTSWAGTSWAGVSWAGVSWAGVSWAGVSWASAAWSAYQWA